MRVFLIHGMGRSPASMWLLAARLRLAGHSPSLFGYAVSVESLEHIASRFAGHISKVLAESEEPWAVIGHSLGNIITRLASSGFPDGFARFIMLAPPNRPPAIARELQDHPLFQFLASDAGQRLCDEDFYEALPRPRVPALIIAGDRGVSADWHPLSARENDAVVAVNETRLEGVPLVVVPGIHSFLMNRRDVFALIRRFLSDAVVVLPDSARISRPPTAADAWQDPPGREFDAPAVEAKTAAS